MTNRLLDFGHLFQIKTIVCLMTKTKFIEQIYDILEEKYFDSDAVKWIIKQCKDYFIKYKKPITLDAFKVKISDINDSILKTTVVETLKEVYKYMEAQDLDFVSDKALMFFKNQALKNAIVESVDILERDGDFDKIKQLIDTAMKAGLERDIGYEYLLDFERRYLDTARDTIDTPWETINELTQGGLAGGELGVIVAASGIGKSWILAALNAMAIKNGKSVIHYTLELNEEYTGLRYDSILTGIPNQNLKYHKDDISKILDKIDGKLTIKYFPPKSASVNTLSAHIQRMKTLGHDVDMIVVDYADEMKDLQLAKEVRHQLGNIYSSLRGLAGEVGVPIWTASQAGRAALEDDVIEAQRVSESYQKVMVADFVMSLSRKVEDKIANTGRFHVIKNRFGPDGITYPAMVNTNTGKIEIYDNSSVNGKKTQNKIDNRDNIARQMLSNKFDDLMGENNDTNKMGQT